MDKQIYYARQRPGAADLNADITNTENYGQEVTKNLIINQDTIVSGFTGSAPGDDTVVITASPSLPSLAYHSNGKKVYVTSTLTLKWDGTSAQPAHVSMDRIDMVCIKHQYKDGDVVPRYFIDANPASPTYGQQITQNVVVNKTDYYEILVLQGVPAIVPSPGPSVSTPPAGYIPLFLVYVRHGTSTVILPTGGTRYGAWDSDIDSDIDNQYFYYLRFIPQNGQVRILSFPASFGSNNNINTGNSTFIHIIGPTSGFTVTGIVAPTYPKKITLYNTTAQNMTIANESGSSTDVNRIYTLTGGDLVSTGTAAYTLIYDIYSSRWIVTSSQP